MHQNGTESVQPDTNGKEGVWVFAEHSEAGLDGGAWKLINEGRDLADKLKADLSVAIIGAGINKITGSLSFSEADKVFAVECTPAGKYTAEIYVSILAELVKKNRPSVILLAVTSLGNDLAPRLAARLRTGLIAKYTEFNVLEDGRLTARKSILAGRVQAVVVSSRKPVVATLDLSLIGLGKAFEKKKTQIIETSVEIDARVRRTRVTGHVDVDYRTVDIREAEIVIGVGKGLDGADNLQAVRDLADVLGAAIGGSRRAVDEGWIPPERQIGLTGKSISPKVYLACGISGSFYHTLGMKESKLVVAVNTDRSAPICGRANLAVIGDMHKIVPALTRQLQEMAKPVATTQSQV